MNVKVETIDGWKVTYEQVEGNKTDWLAVRILEDGTRDPIGMIHISNFITPRKAVKTQFNGYPTRLMAAVQLVREKQAELAGQEYIPPAPSEILAPAPLKNSFAPHYKGKNLRKNHLNPRNDFDPFK